ncbi:MAG: hypothetical protein LQ343_006180 [Gyalolechia ehrenbergii]|nr:MAG: hypothetical protein LQ343_006180 [Gyalolechia ehrenbergii]
MHPLRIYFTTIRRPELQQQPVTSLEERIVPTRRKEIIRPAASPDTARIVRQDFETGTGVADRLIPEPVQVANLHQPYIRIHTAISEQERPSDKVRCMLGCVIAATGTVHEGTRKGLRVSDIKELVNVERRRGLAVENANFPALFGETSVSSADVTLGGRVRVRVPSIPEEPHVLLVVYNG